MTVCRQAWEWLRRNDRLLSPAGFLLRAAVLAILFLLCDAAGLRRYTGALSGTAPADSGARLLHAVLGALYIASYLGFVALAPTLALGAAVFAACDRAVSSVARRRALGTAETPGVGPVTPDAEGDRE